MVLKYRYIYIAGVDKFFFIMSIIDVYDRWISAYYIGLSALPEDAVRILRKAIIAPGVTDGNELVLRTNNDPQFTVNNFQEVYEKLPVIQI